MKKHILNLLLASALFLAGCVVILIAAMAGDFGVYLYNDYDEIAQDTVLFILSSVLTFAASYAVYLIYFLIQRYKANHDPAAGHLGAAPRVIGAVITVAVSVGVALACLFWTSYSAEEWSILASEMGLLIALISAASIAGVVSFIVFKPRP